VKGGSIEAKDGRNPIGMLNEQSTNQMMSHGRSRDGSTGGEVVIMTDLGEAYRFCTETKNKQELEQDLLPAYPEESMSITRGNSIDYEIAPD
jgi:hypothetical protein